MVSDRLFRDGLLVRAVVLGAMAWRLYGGLAHGGQIRSPHSAEACLDCHHNTAAKGDGAQGIPSILVPEGNDPHRVLANSCVGCHPKGSPAFWLIVFSKKRPPAPQSPSGSVSAPSGSSSPIPASLSGKPSFSNPHDTIECGKCHKNKVAFGVESGGEKEMAESTGDISDFCQHCHQEIINRHFPRGNIPFGDTTCLTCHKAHFATGVSHALRDDYYTFIRETREVNPHGGNLFCLTCHPNKPVEGEPAEYLFGEKELNKLCQRCHPGMDHHLIDRPSDKKTWKMDFLNYPLQEGKIACVTCHDAHNREVRGGGVSKYLLRGEPYQKMTDFCQNCHEEKGWEKLNPHDQITPEGEIITRTCLLCHSSVPETNGNQSVRPADFNDNLTAVCTQCHDDFPHPDTNHILVPSTATMSSIRLYESKREVKLPIDFDNRITCVTCHNPHEKGLMTGPDSVGADEEHKLRLTTFNEICTPCHGRH